MSGEGGGKKEWIGTTSGELRGDGESNHFYPAGPCRYFNSGGQKGGREKWKKAEANPAVLRSHSNGMLD